MHWTTPGPLHSFHRSVKDFWHCHQGATIEHPPVVWLEEMGQSHLWYALVDAKVEPLPQFLLMSSSCVLHCCCVRKSRRTMGLLWTSDYMEIIRQKATGGLKRDLWLHHWAMAWRQQCSRGPLTRSTASCPYSSCNAHGRMGLSVNVVKTEVLFHWASSPPHHLPTVTIYDKPLAVLQSSRYLGRFLSDGREIQNCIIFFPPT